jgi:hypothetical protein
VLLFIGPNVFLGTFDSVLRWVSLLMTLSHGRCDQTRKSRRISELRTFIATVLYAFQCWPPSAERRFLAADIPILQLTSTSICRLEHTWMSLCIPMACDDIPGDMTGSAADRSKCRLLAGIPCSRAGGTRYCTALHWRQMFSTPQSKATASADNSWTCLC